MEIIRHPADLPRNEAGISVAIGMFDGVHLGHQAIIRRTVQEASASSSASLVLTFDRHPNTVVAPERAPGLIYPLWKKLQVIETLGPTAVFLIHFDSKFSRLTGEHFIGQLARQCGRLRHVCVGRSFVFGAGRSGDVALLRKMGKELGFVVHDLDPVSLDSHPVSSTRIRQHLRTGDFKAVSRMLGRAYALCGQVQVGDHLGRQLGFPTANLDPSGLLLPPFGVYAVNAILGTQRVPGVLNIGVRPTVKNSAGAVRVEVHLLDFSADLYGHELELELVKLLREERKFPSLEKLREQISADVSAARAALAGRPKPA